MKQLVAIESWYTYSSLLRWFLIFNKSANCVKHTVLYENTNEPKLIVKLRSCISSEPRRVGISYGWVYYSGGIVGFVFLGFFRCYYYRVCLRFGLEIENCFIFAEFINSGKCEIGYF